MTQYPQLTPQAEGNGRLWYTINLNNPNLQTSLLGLFAVAIAKFEGFYIPDSISQRNNNPGNLRPVGASTGFRTFETPLQGWEALYRQIVLNIRRGLTLREFFLGKPGVYPGYAPLGDNPADVMENYIASVASRMSIPDNIDLRNYFPYFVETAEFPFDPATWPGTLWGYKPYEG